MIKKFSTDKIVNQRLKRMIAFAIFFLSVFLSFSSSSKSQAVDYPEDTIPIDPTNYKLELGSFKGLNDSVVALPIEIQNKKPISGINIRFTYDTTFIRPLTVAYDTVIVADPFGGKDTTINPIDSIVFAGNRWNSIESFHIILASHGTAFEGGVLGSGTILFSAWNSPYTHVAAKTDTVGLILYYYFKVSHTAALRSTTILRLKDEPFVGGRENSLAIMNDRNSLKYPFLGQGTFMVDTPSAPIDPCPSDTCPDTCCTAGPPGNNAPVVASIIPSAYEVYQGDSVKFTVSATDQDGDQLTLKATGLPANASFLPSNPVTGTGSVSANFRFVPSFAQSGNFTIDFQATDEHNAASGIRTVSINVKVLDIDRLFSTSTYGGSPAGGIPGARDIIFPIDLSTSKTVYGVQYDMTYPSSVVRIDSFVVTDRAPEYVIYENIGQFPDTVRVVTFGLAGEQIGPGTTSAILNAYMKVDSEAVAGDYWVHLFDAWESIDPNPAIPSLVLRTDSGIVQVDHYGDVNLDKHINVADLVNVVAYIVGSYGLLPRNFATADVVRDATVNVIDLVGIVNLIFGLPVNPSPIQNNSNGGLFATVKIEHDNLSAGQLTKLNVRGEFPDDIAGVQLQIDYDPNAIEIDRPELAEASGGFSLAYSDDHNGRIRMVLYSREPWKQDKLIQAGVGDIVRLPARVKQNINADDKSQIRITEAILSSPNAKEVPVEGSSPILPSTFTLYQNYPNPFNPTTRIEFDIKREGGGQVENAQLHIYNILGQHIKTLVDGSVAAGRHSIGWDATDDSGRPVSTGIYLYRLQVGDRSQTRKMLLLK